MEPRQNESIDHISNPRFLNIPRTKKYRESRVDQISSILGTVPYGDFYRVPDDQKVTSDAKMSNGFDSDGRKRYDKSSCDYEAVLKTTHHCENAVPSCSGPSDDKNCLLKEEGNVSNNEDKNHSKQSLLKDKRISPDSLETDTLSCESLRESQTLHLDYSDNETSLNKCSSNNVTSLDLVEKTDRSLQTDKEIVSTVTQKSPISVRSARVKKPPGGECSDIFNTDPNYVPVTPKTPKSYQRSQKCERVPWGTDEDMRKLPIQTIPTSSRPDHKVVVESSPFNGMLAEEMKLYANSLDASSDHSTPSKTWSDEKVPSTPHSRYTPNSRVCAPFGTDENYTSMSTSEKHANHRTETPWATSNTDLNSSAGNQNETTRAQTRKIQYSKSISQIPF